MPSGVMGRFSVVHLLRAGGDTNSTGPPAASPIADPMRRPSILLASDIFSAAGVKFEKTIQRPMPRIRRIGVGNGYIDLLVISLLKRQFSFEN